MQLPRITQAMELGDRRSSTLPFPFKLHQLLEEAEEFGIDGIISWLPGGEAFKIHDQDAFVSSVMTKYFKQSKIKSFTRQLYIYGFSKISKGTHMGGFFHPDFRRDKERQSMVIPRRIANEDRRIKTNRPQIVDCLKTSLAKAKPAPLVSKSRPHHPTCTPDTDMSSYMRDSRTVPSRLYDYLPTLPPDMTISARPKENDSVQHARGEDESTKYCSTKRALALVDQALDGSLDFGMLPENMPSLGPISHEQSRALPAPSRRLQLDIRHQFAQPTSIARSHYSFPLESLSGGGRMPIPSSHQIQSRCLDYRDEQFQVFEPRSIEDMSENFFKDDEDFAALQALILDSVNNKDP